MNKLKEYGSMIRYLRLQYQMMLRCCAPQTISKKRARSDFEIRVVWMEEGVLVLSSNIMEKG